MPTTAQDDTVAALKEQDGHDDTSRINASIVGADDAKRPSNEYVLVSYSRSLAIKALLLLLRHSHAQSLLLLQNVAFLSFLVFTTVQFFFAVIAKSESMMADCAAMYVDVVTYLFNFLAEKLKHHGKSTMSARSLRIRRLYLELVPPTISVVTLLVVTAMALQMAFHTLQMKKIKKKDTPDLAIMLIFSALNLLLDVINVSCFARVDQAAGIMGSGSNSSDASANKRSSSSLATGNGLVAAATETTPLVLSTGATDSDNEDNDSQDSEAATGINLNMCSAFTVRVLVSSCCLAADGSSWSFSHFSFFYSTLPQTPCEVLPS